MTTDNHKVQLEIEANAGDARGEIASVGTEADKMAQKVQQAGQRAGQGLDKVGQSGEQAAEKLSRAERSIVNAIQRSTAEMRTLGQGSAAKFDELARQRGLDASKIGHYIAALRQAEQEAEALARANARTGLSAKEMAFALRGVPAQFTDIFTSLASGQRPITVLLQQGGQLKDMFGGVGGAAKALGGYIVGLINPITLTIAAAGSLGYAFYAGRKEFEEYQKALILTGNAAGTTAGQLAGMAEKVAASSGATKGLAAEALAGLANTGKVAAGNLSLVAEAAIKMQRAAGVPLAETIKQFEELGQEPVKASEKLNEKTNYLTESIYRQIKALEDQGRVSEAAALAQKAYADAMNERMPQIEANLGYIEKIWKGIASEAKGAWDAMLGVGRKTTFEDRIKELETAQGRGFFKAHRSEAEDQELAALKQIKAEQDRIAAAKAKANEQEKAGIALLREREKFLSKEEQKQRELLKLSAQYEQSAQSEKNRADYLAAVAGVMDKYAEKTKAAKKETDELGKLLDKINAKEAGLDASFWQDLGTLNVAYKAGKLDIDAYRVAVEKLVAQQKFHQDALKVEAQWQKELSESRAKDAAEATKEAEALRKKAGEAEYENRIIGMTKAQLADATMARYDEQIAIKESQADLLRGNEARQGELYAIELQIEALQRLKAAAGDKSVRQANQKAIEDQAKAWENFSRDIEQSLTDALMRGFEAGESFGENFVKTLQNTLKTAALKIAVQMVVQPVMGSMGQALGVNVGAAGGGGAGGIGNLLSTGNSLSNLVSGGGFLGGFSAGAASVASELALGSAFFGPSATLAGGSVGLGASAAAATGSAAGAGALSSAASALPYVGLALGALALFGGDLFGGKEKPPEINIQNLPKGYKWGMSAGAGPFGELQMAGKHLGETEQEVQKMVDALLKPIIQADTALAALLTGEEVKAISGALSGWTTGEVEFESEAQIQEMVKARFAVISDTIGGWVDELADTVTGTSEEVYNAFGKILAVRNMEGAQGIAETILGVDGGRFSKESETLADTFNRLMSSLTSVNAAFDLLDTNLLMVSADSAVWADRIVEAFGGLQTMQSSVAAYYDKYYSDAEKVANTVDALSKEFGKLGYELPASKDELRKWIEAVPLLTDEQQKTYAELIKLAPAFSDLADAMAKTTDTVISAAEAERMSEIEARRAMQKAAQTSMDAARDGLNTLKTGLAAESSRTAGGYAGGSYLDAAELERYSGFVEYLTEAGAELQKLADLNVAGEMAGAISSIKGMMDEAARELASRLSIERLLAGNAGGAIGAASAPGMAGLTWEGNAGAFNAQIAEVQARAAAGLLNAANANALTIPNIDSVLDQLIQTAGENPGGRGLLGVRAAAEAYSRAITDGVEQEIREGLAANLGRAGLESVAFYFGQIGEQAKKLTAASIEANDALAQTNAAIGRLGSVGAVFGQSAAAAYYGFMDGGAEGRMYLNDPATGAKISQSALIASAAQIAAGIMTTADAAAVAKKLSDQFTDKRGASLLLDGLKQYDAGSFENAFLRMNDALVKGALNEAQYTELFGLAVDEFTGASEEAAKMGETFERVRDAARSLADELMVDPNTSRLSRNNMLGETRRQWEDAMTRATAMQDSSGLESSARNYLRAVSESTASGDVYDQGFAQVIADLRGLEQLFPPKPATKTTDDVVAELNSMRSDMRALGAQQSSNDQKLNRLLQSVYDGDALQVRVLT